MAKERTLSIIKPDATRRNLTGKINAVFEDAGLSIVAQKRVQLSHAVAGAFYAVHKERPFYNDLVSFMISGPVVVQVLEAKTPLPKTVKSWVQPTPKRPTPRPFAPSLLKALKQTPCMVPTARKMLQTKSASSLQKRKSCPNSGRSHPGVVPCAYVGAAIMAVKRQARRLAHGRYPAAG